MTNAKNVEMKLQEFLATPSSCGYQQEVNNTAKTYGETRGGVLKVLFGITAFPDFIRPNYQVIFGDNSVIAFRGDNHCKDNRVQSEYNPGNLSSGFKYDGNRFVKIEAE